MFDAPLKARLVRKEGSVLRDGQCERIIANAASDHNHVFSSRQDGMAQDGSVRNCLRNGFDAEIERSQTRGVFKQSLGYRNGSVVAGLPG